MDNDLPLNNDNQNSLNPSPIPASDKTDDTPSVPSSPIIPPISGPEGVPVTETPPSVEAIPQIETISNQFEKLTTPEIPVAEGVKEVGSEPDKPVPPSTPTPDVNLNVVDKRDEKESLTSISGDSDELTSKADDEEEDFIKHVEEVHTIAS